MATAEQLAWLQQAYGAAAVAQAAPAPAGQEGAWAAQWAAQMQDPTAAQSSQAQAWAQAAAQAQAVQAAQAGMVTPQMALQLQQMMGQGAPVAPQQKGCGKGKGKKGDKDPNRLASESSDAIYIAINTAMQNVTPDDITAPGEGAWDPETLKRRIAKYFRSGAKGLNFGGGDFKKVINEFADTALSNVSWALQGTKFLSKADFTLVVEVAIGELFPENFREQCPPEVAFEEVILQAHDRALEEARFSPLLMDTVKEMVEGKKAQNKVYNAAETARRDIVTKMLETQDETQDFFYASENGVMGKIQDFTKEWITATIKGLGDWPEGVLEEKDAKRLFDKLLTNEECCLPRSLVRYMVEPLPEPWDFVETVLKELYQASAAANREAAEASAKKRRKDEGPNFLYKTEMCRNMQTSGTCRMGDWCVFAHDPSELWHHKGGLVQMVKGAAPMMGKGVYPEGGKEGCWGKGQMEGGWGKDAWGKDGWGCKGKDGCKGKGKGKPFKGKGWGGDDWMGDGEAFEG